MDINCAFFLFYSFYITPLKSWVFKPFCQPGVLWTALRNCWWSKLIEASCGFECIHNGWLGCPLMGFILSPLFSSWFTIWFNEVKNFNLSALVWSLPWQSVSDIPQHQCSHLYFCIHSESGWWSSMIAKTHSQSPPNLNSMFGHLQQRVHIIPPFSFFFTFSFFSRSSF